MDSPAVQHPAMKHGMHCYGLMDNGQGVAQHKGWHGGICCGQSHREVKQLSGSWRKFHDGRTRCSKGLSPLAVASGRALGWSTKSPLEVEPNGQYLHWGAGDAAPQAGHTGQGCGGGQGQ